MTNYEKIKNMSVEEMAEFLQNSQPYCTLSEGDCVNGWHGYTCDKHAKQWLNSEVEELNNKDLKELEAYRNTAQSPDDIMRMQERFYELAVENNALRKELEELKGKNNEKNKD